MNIEQSTNKEKNKIYITRYQNKDPVKYKEILSKAKRSYYQRNKEKIMEDSRLYRQRRKIEFDFLKTYYDNSENKSE
jgi:predicted solute-binding protein